MHPQLLVFIYVQNECIPHKIRHANLLIVEPCLDSVVYDIALLEFKCKIACALVHFTSREPCSLSEQQGSQGLGNALVATWLRLVANSEVAPAAIFIQSTRFVTVSFGLCLGAEDSGNVSVVKFLRWELLTIR